MAIPASANVTRLLNAPDPAKAKSDALVTND